MAPGITPESALAELNSIYSTLPASSTSTAGGNISITGLTLHEWMVHRARPRMLLFGSAVVLVMVIACVNVANLLIARGEARDREMAVCAALGADRLTLALRALADSVVLGIGGGLLGISFAIWGVRLLVTAYADDIPRASTIHPDATLFVIGFGATFVASILAGVLPALHVSPGRFSETLRSGGRSGGSGRPIARRALVILEVALAVVLVSGAALLLNSLWRLSHIDLGVEKNGVLTFSVGLPAARYSTPETIARTFHEIAGDLRGVPGILAAGATTRQPLFGGTNGTVSVPGAGSSDRVELRAVTPGYFDALGMRIVAGREFTSDDVRAGRRNVIVNETFARTLVGAGDPIGRALTVGTDAGYEIVGVVSDVREFGPEAAAPAVASWATGSLGPSWTSSSYMTIAVKAEGEPQSLIPSIRASLHTRDRDLAMDNVFTLDELARRRLGRDRQSAMSLFSLFAALALVLGAVGIYGVISYGVQQRTRELGIRMALGASSDRVLRLIVGEGLRLAALGTALGVAAALVAGQALSSLLFGIRPTDPTTLVAVSLVVLIVATIASTWPAVRAARLEPVEALRRE
jgi:predicted permease